MSEEKSIGTKITDAHREKTKMSAKNLLSMEFYSSELNLDLNLKEYFIILAQTAWREGEGFSGKRPFGNSGWQWEVYAAMIKNGFVKGKLDDDGYIEDIETADADKIIEKALDKWIKETHEN